MNRVSDSSSEELRRIFRQAPFVDHVGLELVSLGLGECETRLRVREHHLQQDSFVHAGVMATIAVVPKQGRQ